MTTTAKIPPLGYLSDQETKVDLLNNEAIARTIVRLIDETTDSAVTIGVHGDWGAGKSSVLEMVEAAYPDGGEVLCLKFSGWQFQGFEDAKIALIEGVVNGLIEKRSLTTKAADEVKRVLKSVDWLKVAKKGGGFRCTPNSGHRRPSRPCPKSAQQKPLRSMTVHAVCAQCRCAFRMINSRARYGL